MKRQTKINIGIGLVIFSIAFGIVGLWVNAFIGGMSENTGGAWGGTSAILFIVGVFVAVISDAA